MKEVQVVAAAMLEVTTVVGSRAGYLQEGFAVPHLYMSVSRKGLHRLMIHIIGKAIRHSLHVI